MVKAGDLSRSRGSGLCVEAHNLATQAATWLQVMGLGGHGPLASKTLYPQHLTVASSCAEKHPCTGCEHTYTGYEHTYTQVVSTRAAL